MIWESWPWKRALIHDVNIIRSWSKKRSSARQETLLEKKIFISAYSIRKLIEAYKLTDRVKNTKIKCGRIENLGRVPDLLTTQYEKFFDFSKCKIEHIPLLFLCNQIIHSFIFYFEAGNKHGERITAFYVTSDRKKNACIYRVLISDYCKMIDKVGRDFVTSSRWARTSNGFDVRNN